MLQGSQSGQVTVTVVKDGISSNAVNVIVTEAVVTEIQVTPALVNVAKGQAVTLTAMAIYSDGTTADVTSIATWSPNDENLSPAMSAGMRLVAEEKGFTYLVTAETEGVVSNTAQVTVTEAEITSIQVTPDPVNVAKGQTEQLTATATYTDGTTSDVTSSVVWATDDVSKATVTTTGLLTGEEQGLATVTATLEEIISNTVGVTVSAAKIISIQVTPDSVNVAKGQTEQLMAMATYSDGTSSDVSNAVLWVSDDLDTATVALSGLLYGAGEGSTTVIAEKEGVTSNTVNVSVSAAQVTSIQVTPALVEVEKGFTEQLTATATYSDSTTANVTTIVAWVSGDTNIATVTADGELMGVDVGATTVSATLDSVMSEVVNVNVTSCSSLANACIDIFDTGSGKLFTSSPSVAYLDSIGGSPTNGFVEETKYTGPIGMFYLFNRDNAFALCDTYNAINLGGRSNWYLATKDELHVELYKTYGNMFTARGWPTAKKYWSESLSSANGSYAVDLYFDSVSTYSSNYKHYAVCVSNP